METHPYLREVIVAIDSRVQDPAVLDAIHKALRERLSALDQKFAIGEFEGSRHLLSVNIPNRRHTIKATREKVAALLEGLCEFENRTVTLGSRQVWPRPESDK